VITIERGFLGLRSASNVEFLMAQSRNAKRNLLLNAARPVQCRDNSILISINHECSRQGLLLSLFSHLLINSRSLGKPSECATSSVATSKFSPKWVGRKLHKCRQVKFSQPASVRYSSRGPQLTFLAWGTVESACIPNRGPN
jgi:hypothetical protein